MRLVAAWFLRGNLSGDMDAQEIDQVVEARLKARAEKNWAESDRIRDLLTAKGIVLEDGKEGTRWRKA